MFGLDMSCQCLGCSDPATHVTSDHVCSVCKKKGHGRHECGPGLRSRLRRTALSRAAHTALAPQLQCSFPECTDRTTHTTAGHRCTDCARRLCRCTCDGRSCRHPPSFLKGIKCPICRAEGTANLKTSLYTGDKCVICRDQQKLCSILPCGHVNCCRSCLLQMTLPSI